MTRPTLVLAIALMAALAAPVRADPSAEERAAMQTVISSQIEAFKRDDGQAAYGFAAEPIQRLFPTPEAFLEMVRRAYAPVYRPKTVVFGSMSEEAGGAAQEVLITDAAGVDWIARYTLAKGPDGRWRITGCRLVRNQRDQA